VRSFEQHEKSLTDHLLAHPSIRTACQRYGRTPHRLEDICGKRVANPRATAEKGNQFCVEVTRMGNGGSAHALVSFCIGLTPLRADAVSQGT
jgi:hypothetical protein